MELDYQSILLQGYLDPKKRLYFTDYLYRQYQEARKENYNANEFFGGCSHEIQRMKGMVEADFQARKININKLLVGIRSGKIKDDSGHEKRLVEELSLLKVEDFPLNLLNATNHKFMGQLEYGHLRAIELLIGEAIQKIDHSMPLEEKKPRKSKIVAIEEENNSKEIIKEIFNEVDNNKGWKYIFRTETDFETFSELLSRYFDKKECQTPTETIQVQRGCKTRLANSLGRILRQLSFYKKLSDDTNYFELVRVLTPFKEETDTQIYKAITREKE